MYACVSAPTPARSTGGTVEVYELGLPLGPATVLAGTVEVTLPLYVIPAATR